MQDRIKALMGEPPPRRVPTDILKWAVNPIARFLILMGGSQILLCTFLSFFRDPSRSSRWGLTGFLVICVLVLVPAMGMIGWGMLSKRRTLKVLAEGLM